MSQSCFALKYIIPIGITPRASKVMPHRGDEIVEWLDVHGRNLHETAFVILDDMGLTSFDDQSQRTGEGLGTHLVQTDGAVGLTNRDCDMAVQAVRRQQRRFSTADRSSS